MGGDITLGRCWTITVTSHQVKAERAGGLGDIRLIRRLIRHPSRYLDKKKNHKI